MTAEAEVDASAVLDFWFGAAVDDGIGARAPPRPEWFRKDTAFDAVVAKRFGATLEAALAGRLAAWAGTPAGALALIVVLDQFTRNAFRDTPRAFAGDAQALALARALVAEGHDRGMSPLQRWFAYMPFEHAEDIGLQHESLRLFGSLAAEHPHTQQALDYAVKHRDVVARFGRYPHRNAVLGRESTATELAFLSQPGASF